MDTPLPGPLHLHSLNKRKHAVGVFVDLQKTFDTLDHQLLCNKLECYGIRSVTYKWIKGYLSKTMQRFSYDEHNFERLRISRGVP